jgi:hypothetical protein
MGFLLGAIIGGAAMYFYGGQVRDYVDQKTRGARDEAADALHAAAEGLQSATEKARQRMENVAEAARPGTYPGESRPPLGGEPGRRVG